MTENRMNYINTWPDDLAEEPDAAWRATTCRTCGAEFATKANTGVLPALCLTCDREHQREVTRINTQRSRQRQAGVPEDDLPVAPSVPAEPESDGEWLQHDPRLVFPITDRQPEDGDITDGDGGGSGQGIETARPRYVNPLGLHQRIGGRLKDTEVGPVRGIGVKHEERLRKIAKAEQAAEHRTRLAKQEIAALVTRGRKAIDRLASKQRALMEWHYHDILADIARQEDVEDLEVIYIDGLPLTLNWERTMELRQSRRERELSEVASLMQTDAPLKSYASRAPKARSGPARKAQPVEAKPVTETAAWWVGADGQPLKPSKAELRAFMVNSAFVPPADETM